MFDMSWGEIMVIGAVALIVIGPKDLPKALRTVGQATAKLRRMAGEFQTQFNDAMREAELDEIRRQVDSASQSVTSFSQTSFDPIQTARDELKGSIEGRPAAALPAAPASPPAEPAATVVLPPEPAPAAEPPRPSPDKPGSAAA